MTCTFSKDIINANAKYPPPPEIAVQPPPIPLPSFDLSSLSPFLSIFPCGDLNLIVPFQTYRFWGPISPVIDDPYHGGPDNYIMLVLKLLIDDKTERYIALKIINFLLLFIVKDKFH